MNMYSHYKCIKLHHQHKLVFHALYRGIPYKEGLIIIDMGDNKNGTIIEEEYFILAK